jgi:Rrf2 family protein
MFSKTFAYALRAVTYLAANEKGNQSISLSQISDAIDVPHHFLGKVMQDLVRRKIISSMKGPGGGFVATNHTLDITVLDLLKAVDGAAILNNCMMGKKNCSDSHPCPLHKEYVAARNALLKSMQKTSIREMARKVNSGSIYLNEMQ